MTAAPDTYDATSQRDAAGAVRASFARALYLQIVDSGIPDEIRSGDPDGHRRARIILGFTLALILLGFETAAFFSWVLPLHAATRISVSLAVGLSLTLLIPSTFRRGGSLTAGANLVIGASYLVILATFTVLGGIRAPVLHWCALLPMLAALMGTPRSAWAWAGIGLLTLGFFTAADVIGWPFENYLDLFTAPASVLRIQRFVDVGSWLGILLAVALLYESHTKQQTRALATKNAELESQSAKRERVERRNLYLAYYDELTSLPNRRLFKQQLSQAMFSAPRHGRLVAILFLDLDGFKRLNDTHGHAVGDELLQKVAQRLRSCLRLADSVSRGDETEIVSRLGGDEFTILLGDLRNHREAAIVAERILRGLQQPIMLRNHEVFISGSIGIALYPGAAEDIDELMRNADLAMYHAKDSGRNNYQFFDPSMNADVTRRSALANELRRALEQDEFELYFQPIVEAETHRISGVEALIRWNNPERGVVLPNEFIEIAEESGTIIRLGDWVIEQACQHYAKWHAAGIAPERVAINVSALQFKRGRIVRTVIEAVRRAGLDPGCLELEITENAMMLDEDETARSLAELKAFGVHIALDDFGTGYSSLSYVKRFPVDSLKIDRSFVGEIECDPEAQAIATAIIAMAHRLALKVVGEGVESEAQERFLRDHGCDELQGYRYGRPVPADEISRVLAGR